MHGRSGSKLDLDSAEQEFIPVGQVMVVIANSVILVVTGIMAINWMLASPEKKAKLKEQLIGLVVAIFVIYAGVFIWTTVRQFMEGVESTLEQQSTTTNP